MTLYYVSIDAVAIIHMLQDSPDVSFNQGRGKVLRLALYALSLSQRHVARSLGKNHVFVNLVLNDRATSAPLIESITELVISAAIERGRNDVLSMIDWVDAPEAV